MAAFELRFETSNGREIGIFAASYEIAEPESQAPYAKLKELRIYDGTARAGRYERIATYTVKAGSLYINGQQRFPEGGNR